MTEEEFVTKYQEIIDNQEFARSEIPQKFEYLRGGVFINTLPEKVESEDSELYSYHQTFTMETNEELLEKNGAYARLYNSQFDEEE